MTTGRHILFWIAGLFAFTLVVPLMTSPNALWTNVTSELAMIQSAFGANDTHKLSKTATQIYNAVFEDSGAVKTTRAAEVSEEERVNADPLFGAGGRFIISVTNNYVTTLSVLYFVVTLRFLIVLSWMPYLVPFLGAVVIEGLVRRKIKLSAIGAANPVKFAISKHILIVILVFPIVYLVLPIAFTPLFMPIWGLCVSWPLVVLISNILPAGGT